MKATTAASGADVEAANVEIYFLGVGEQCTFT